MAGNQTPPPPGRPSDDQPGAGQGWAAMSYLIGGIVVWGFVGWLVDNWLDLDGIGIGVGSLVGAAGGIYLILRRLGGA